MRQTHEDGIETQRYNTSYEYDANGNIERLTREGNVGAMDNLTYRYTKDGNGNILNNRLLHVNDAVAPTVYDDIDDQGAYVQNNPDTHNYGYDKIGNLISDKQEKIADIQWDVNGKITKIIRTTGSSKANLHFRYDAMGNRVSKTVIYPNVTGNSLPKEETTFYVRDAQGNVMAVYEKKLFNDNTEELFLAEQHLYGSSRLGMRQTNLLLAKTGENVEFNLAKSGRMLGEKVYQMENHLGNVLAVVSDKRLANNEPDIVSVSDYYPFGMVMSGRSYKSNAYRFGFQNQEKETEITGSESHSFFKYRISDNRLGRFFSVDPLYAKYPWNSSYAFSENDVIGAVELEGLEKLALSGSVPPYQYDRADRQGIFPNTAYNKNHVEGYAKQTKRLEKKYGFHTQPVGSGKEILDRMQEETKNHGEITHLFFFGHGFDKGWLLRANEGFYVNDRQNYGGSADLSELQNMMVDNKIKFSESAIIFIDACNSGGKWGSENMKSMAAELVLTTGATVIAADGHVEMSNPGTKANNYNDAKYNGKFTISDGGTFYKFTRVGTLKSDSDGNSTMEYSVKFEEIGTTVSADDYTN